MTEKIARTATATASVIDSNSKLLNYSTRVVVVLVAVGAAVLSFDALTALALASGIRAEFSWIWAVVVDGFILVATFAAFALKDRGGRSKYYAWTTLGVFVTISILGNAWHAAIAKEGYIMPMGVAVIVTAIPPLALFLAIHLLVIMVSPTEEQKAEILRHRKKQERLRALEEKELERLEKISVAKEIKASAAASMVASITETKEVAEAMGPVPEVTVAPLKLHTTVIDQISAVAGETLTEDQAIARLSEMSHNGDSLPTGKAVAGWLGKSERTGQNLVKRFKSLN